MKNQVLGVCGGNGVILRAMKSRLVANVEPRRLFHTKNHEQWKVNFGEIPYYKTIQEAADTIPIGDVQVIVGAPDCGHSSVLSYSRAKSFSDPRKNHSLNTYIEAVNYYQPFVWMMENLPALLKQIKPDELEGMMPGYHMAALEMSVSAWGNSQVTRNRLVLIGIKDGENWETLMKHFTNVYPVAELKTCEQLERIADDIQGDVREPDDTMVPMEYNHVKLNLGQIRDVWNNEFAGKSRWEMPGTKMKNLPGVYKNEPDKYPKTARKETRQFDTDGNVLTPRDLAVIQGIPNSFEIYIPETDDVKVLKYWLNKARVTVTKTPPYEIGKWFSRQLRKFERNKLS